MFNPKLLKFKKNIYKDPHHNKGLEQLQKDLGTVENNLKKMMKEEEKAEGLGEGMRKVKSIKPLKFKF
jgi:hypothetical protein